MIVVQRASLWPIMMAVAHQVFGLVPTDFAQLAPIVIVPPCEPFHCPHQQASLGSTELDYTDVRRPVVRGQELSLNLRVTFRIISWLPFHICKFWRGFFSWAQWIVTTRHQNLLTNFKTLLLLLLLTGHVCRAQLPSEVVTQPHVVIRVSCIDYNRF